MSPFTESSINAPFRSMSCASMTWQSTIALALERPRSVPLEPDPQSKSVPRTLRVRFAVQEPHRSRWPADGRVRLLAFVSISGHSSCRGLNNCSCDGEGLCTTQTRRRGIDLGCERAALPAACRRGDGVLVKVLGSPSRLQWQSCRLDRDWIRWLSSIPRRLLLESRS
jgi:hypothetical protein